MQQSCVPACFCCLEVSKNATASCLRCGVISSLREDEPSPLPPLLLRRNNVWKPEKYSTSKLATDFLKGRGGGGQVVNVLAFYPCGLSSNPTEAYSFFHKMCV